MNFTILDDDSNDSHRFVFTGEFRLPRAGDWFWCEGGKSPTQIDHDWKVLATDPSVPEFNWRRHIMKEVK